MKGPHDWSTIWKLGFGTASETTLIDGFGEYEGSMVAVVVSSNLPQLCFSFLYFQYNALFTGMLAAREWSIFGLRPRGLRVSCNPRGKQRERYFLQLPYRWGVPLLLVSILVHWLLSLSIFLVCAVTSEGIFFSACGYSPVAIMTVILVSFLMVLAVVITGRLRLPTAIPVVGSCSLAIAAACHHDEGVPQPDEAFAGLQWGVTRRSGDEDGKGGMQGHCGFSSGHVEEPQAGATYA